MDYAVATEEELRTSKTPSPKTIEELEEFITTLVDRGHGYGTCVYAMSLAAEAAFNYVAHRLGVTGFQASCADMHFLARTRGMKLGFAIVNYANLLYPQYLDDEHFPNWKQLIEKNKEALSKEAKRLLSSSTQDDIQHTYDDVLAHWKYLANLV